MKRARASKPPSVTLETATAAIADAIAGLADHLADREGPAGPLEIRSCRVTLSFAISQIRDSSGKVQVQVDAESLRDLPEHAVSHLTLELVSGARLPTVEGDVS